MADNHGKTSVESAAQAFRERVADPSSSTEDKARALYDLFNAPLHKGGDDDNKGFADDLELVHALIFTLMEKACWNLLEDCNRKDEENLFDNLAELNSLVQRQKGDLGHERKFIQPFLTFRSSWDAHKASDEGYVVVDDASADSGAVDFKQSLWKFFEENDIVDKYLEFAEYQAKEME